MLRDKVVVLGAFLAASPLAAQDNPFGFTGGSVKSAYIVYDMVAKANPGQGFTFEIGVAPDRMIVRSAAMLDIGGKKDTIRGISVTTKDSQYNYSRMGSQPAAGEVGPTLRPHLAREYAALNAAGKARFKENVKLAIKASGSNDDVAEFITLTGDKTGSETIGGHKCDVYKQGQVVACVIPQAPMVMLRWANPKDGVNMVAKKITLNGPLPPAASLFPKGIVWKKKLADDADFITNVWEFKKQSDHTTVAPAAIAQFAVRYLATAEATTDLRAMQGDETGAAEEAPDDEAESDEDGN